MKHPATKILLTLLLSLTLSACMNKQLNIYEQEQPSFTLEEYFQGDIRAWGLIQDFRGRVVRRFDVEMQGRWEGDEGVLEEQFQFYDGEQQERIWRIRKLPDGSYEGRADDILNTATGSSSGNAMRWKYVMLLKIDGREWQITFDDWMFLLNDGVLINRSYMKKFGFTVAELSLFMQKQ